MKLSSIVIHRNINLTVDIRSSSDDDEIQVYAVEDSKKLDDTADSKCISQ